ncbi:MAG: DNA-binding protein [Actinobacteria bacterium]|nr:DNA-binding protein [Actinomycetota bacterium]
MAQVPVVEDILELSDEPHLVGSRCRSCGTHVFPRQDGCPRCTATDMERVALARRGTLWTWTVQGFAPKAPPYLGDTEHFEPFGVGYVELPHELKVEARLTEADPERLHVGMEMELVLVPLSTDDDGNEIVTFGFQPVEEERSS